MSEISALDQACSAALRRWQGPWSGFTSGRDPRSSDNALLVLMYGGLIHAARHEWLNAGRRLIDKTYIDILWHVQHLTTLRTCRPEQIAAALDNFIRDQIEPVWDGLADLNATDQAELASRWVADMAQQCFGSLHSQPAASRLLFFLCPMLPLFNLSRGHLLALQRLGHTAQGEGYHAYAAAAEHAYRARSKALRALPGPAPVFGDAAQRRLIQQLLDDSDWWERRVFDAMLRQTAQAAGVEERLFACDDAGQLVT
ncbi:MAG: hypothetical protein WBM84_12215 [Sedimenticolaceae bacterium]